MTRACIALASAVLSLSLSLAPRAQAQDELAARRAARSLYEDGVAAAQERRWEDARDAFERSLALQPTSLTWMNLAGAQSHTGHLVAAAETYRRFLRDATDAERARYGPAVERALVELEPRIAEWTIDVPGLVEGDEVMLDDVRLAGAALGVSLPVDPGAHEARVLRAGELLARESFVAEEGAHGRTTLELPTAEAPVERVDVALHPSEIDDAAIDALAPTAILAARDDSATRDGTVPHDETALWIGLGVGAGVVVIVAVVTLAVVLGAPAQAARPEGNVPPIATF